MEYHLALNFLLLPYHESDELDSDICCEEAEKFDAQKSVIIDVIGRLKTLGTIPHACRFLILSLLSFFDSNLCSLHKISCVRGPTLLLL